MAKIFLNKLTLIKIIIALNLYVYCLLYRCNTSYPILKNDECISTYCSENQFEKEECIIDNPIVKEKWLNNILIFENTTGYNSLSKTTSSPYKLILKTTSSDNKQTKIFMLNPKDLDDYQFELFTSKSFDKTEIIKNEQALIFIYNLNIYIISIGIDNSPIEIINWETQNLNYIESNSFLKEDKRIIKSTSVISKKYAFSSGFGLIYGAVTILEDEPLKYYLRLYYYILESSNLDVQFQYSIDLDLTKKEYASCFVYNENLGSTSCFYLSQENLYKIILIENNLNFIIRNEIVVQNLSDTNDENLYFLKGINIEQKITGESLCLYSYYSGESNNIPTFLIKKIENFSLEDLYPDLPLIYLEEKNYLFNNNLYCNDVTFKNDHEFYFISTNKIDIIISYIQIYINSLEENKTIVRYYILKLKEYHNFNVFKL